MFSRFLVVCLAAAACAAQAAVVEIVHVWPEYREAASFRRLSEFIDGRERSGREPVVRSQKTSRDGFYFLTRTKSESALTGATLVVEVVLPGDPTPKSYSFPADVPAGKCVFHLGLTGTDWSAPEVQPVAWRISVRDSAGKSLAESPSFLWSTPPPAPGS